MKKLIFIFILLLCSSIVNARDYSSPVGEWYTYSDKTNDRSGIVKVFEIDGKLFGKIIKIFPGNGRNTTDRCEKCSGELKNKPVLGLTFFWNFTPEGNGVWKGDQLLDPQEGNIYKGTITLLDNGNKLELRGSWGIFSRTQTWVRIEK